MPPKASTPTSSEVIGFRSKDPSLPRRVDAAARAKRENRSTYLDRVVAAALERAEERRRLKRDAERIAQKIQKGGETVTVSEINILEENMLRDRQERGDAQSLNDSLFGLVKRYRDTVDGLRAEVREKDAHIDSLEKTFEGLRAEYLRLKAERANRKGAPRKEGEV
jgi:uncharacterized coiled-coil DUF342 family protein